MKEEIWKDIEGYDGLYQISNFGNVRSLDRVIINSYGVKRLWKGKIMKPTKNRCGYLYITISKSSEVKNSLWFQMAL